MKSSQTLSDLQRQEKEWEFDNLPNRLTMVRMALVPVVIVLLYLASDISFSSWAKKWCGPMASFLFVVASITDFFDGYFARKRGIVTVFGSFLDPVADKFLVVSSLIMLLALRRVPAWIVVILVLRELYVTSLRLLAREKELSVPVDEFGKWKTTFQMIAIPMLMAYDNHFIPMPQMGAIFIYLACALSLFSSIRYSWGLFVKLKQKRQNKLRQLRQLKKEFAHAPKPDSE